MNARTARGPISRLDDLPALERRFVICARRWHAAPACGPGVAAGASADLDAFLGLLAAHGRRPLQFGRPGAEGVSGDECVLARVVALAAEGAREDAILIATLLLRADLALGLGRIAEGVGLGLLRERAATRRDA